MPYELARKNFKTTQRYVEREQTYIAKELKNATNGASAAATTGDASATLTQLDTMINRMQGLKRKLETLHSEETAIHKATKTRIQHLDDLYDIPSLADVKYEEWSKVRLDRLLVDYLLRSGYGESAKALAKEKDIEDLVDVDAFVQCERIAESLRHGRCQEALAWCGDNKQGLKKLEVRLDRCRHEQRSPGEHGPADEGSALAALLEVCQAEWSLLRESPVKPSILPCVVFSSDKTRRKC